MPFDLDKIGDLLKAAREEKGLTREEVARALFIGKSTIGAIESGDWQNLPHLVYVKGYITQYASFLNVREIVKAEVALRGVRAGPTGAPDPGRASERAAGALGCEEEGSGDRGHLTDVLAFLVFLNVQRPAHLTQPRYQAGKPVQGQATQNQPAAATSRRREAGRDAGSQDGRSGRAERLPDRREQDRAEGAYDQQKEKVVLDTKKLMIACQERTWVRIVIDGSERKEFTLNPEEVVVLNAKEKFDLLIGNAAGVKLFYNGKDVGLTGESGEVKRVTLS